MAPRRPGNGRLEEPGETKHPGMAQGKRDPPSNPQFSFQQCLIVFMLYYNKEFLINRKIEKHINIEMKNIGDQI